MVNGRWIRLATPSWLSRRRPILSYGVLGPRAAPSSTPATGEQGLNHQSGHPLHSGSVLNFGTVGQSSNQFGFLEKHVVQRHQRNVRRASCSADALRGEIRISSQWFVSEIKGAEVNILGHALGYRSSCLLRAKPSQPDNRPIRSTLNGL
ncbi:hypothetical protein SRHO_G00171460 [Serrasalmus rhombeus]